MCPDDSGGVYTVPPGTIVNTGDTLLPSQHNPWALDMSTAMSNRFSKDGRAPATGNWNLNTFRITNLGAPVATNDAVNKAYADGLATTFADQGALFGLRISNNAGDAVNDIDIAIGSAAASNTANPFKMVLASALGKRLDAAWAVGGTPGSTVGGLDTGAIADTTYHVYLMQRSDTGVVDACFSTSATTPTVGGAIPAAYDRFRRIGSIIRSGATILGFTQIGKKFVLNNPFVARSNTAPLAASLLTFAIPGGIQTEPLIITRIDWNATSMGQIAFGSASVGNITTTVHIAGGNSAGNSSITIGDGFLSNTSQQIYAAQGISVGTLSAGQIANFGWIDTFL